MSYHNGPIVNAYEDDNPGRRMPSPSNYQSQDHNPWGGESYHMESTKIETSNGHTPDIYSSNNAYEHTPNDAYRHTGTAYGNQGHIDNAYSSTPVPPSPQVPPTPARYTATPEVNTPAPGRKQRPSKLRLLFRVLQFLASVGHLGFAAGASPYSGHAVPFDSSACFYYLFAVAVLTIIWSGFHIFYYFYRLVSGTKMKRPVLIGVDLLLAILWGIGIIVEIAKYHCPPGGFDRFCDFYNVSIFFGFLAFVLFILATGWDVLGACRNRQ